MKGGGYIHVIQPRTIHRDAHGNVIDYNPHEVVSSSQDHKQPDPATMELMRKQKEKLLEREQALAAAKLNRAAREEKHEHEQGSASSSGEHILSYIVLTIVYIYTSIHVPVMFIVILDVYI